MALQKFANNATGTTTGTIPTGGTTFTLQSGEGAEFPALGTNEYCYVRLGSDSLNEVVKVTARSGDVLTCVTTTAAWAADTPVILTASKEMFGDLAQKADYRVIGLALARMRGVHSSVSGVFLATGDPATSTDLKVVAQGTPNMSVLVKAGACLVNGVFAGIDEDLTIAIPAPLTNSQIVIIQINQLGEVSKKNGTESGSPVAPTPDTNNYKLGQVLLTTAHTDIENSDCTDPRVAI